MLQAHVEQREQHKQTLCHVDGAPVDLGTFEAFDEDIATVCSAGARRGGNLGGNEIQTLMLA